VVAVLAPAAVSAQVAAAMRAQKLRVPLVAAGSGLGIGLPDGVMVDGMAAAYDMAAVMFRASPVLTRQNLVTALDGMPQGPRPRRWHTH